MSGDNGENPAVAALTKIVGDFEDRVGALEDRIVTLELEARRARDDLERIDHELE